MLLFIKKIIYKNWLKSKLKSEVLVFIVELNIVFIVVLCKVLSRNFVILMV